MTLAEQLLRALKSGGAREVFGIPGDFALPLFKEIEESGVLPLYTLSHEPAVAFAADAAARYNCGLGVVAVTYGAGALNIVNAIACAYAEHSPVVILSGAPSAAERASGLLLHHQVKTIDSQARIFREITCDQAVLDNAATAPGEIARVLRSCREHARPVYIEIPRDMARAPCGPVEALPPSPFDPAAVAACAEEVLARLRVARKPVVMVDVDVRRHSVEDRVATLASRLGLPIVTSVLGRGLLAHSAVRPVGTYLGMAGDPRVSELVETSDCLLLLGVVLSDTNLAGGARRIERCATIHAIDRQVQVGFHVYPDIPLEALIDALLAKSAAASRRTAPELAPLVPAAAPSGDALVPADVVAAVRELLAAHGPMPIAADVGDCLFTAMDIADTDLVAPGYYAGMGFGVPAGLGVQATSGARPLILVGDGAFQMTGWELGNCQRYGWDPIVVVLNNRGWEMLRAFQPESRFNDLDDWHFAAIAPSLGGEGTRVETRRELREALGRAAATRGRFQLIEAMIERGRRSETLDRFVRARGSRPSPSTAASDIRTCREEAT